MESSFEEMSIGGGVVCKDYIYAEEKQLSVMKTSLFYPGDGFAAYDCTGKLVFRVDSYSPDSDKGELVLMNATGKCLLTVRRKRPSLHHRWEGFIGERKEDQNPLFSIRRLSIIGRSGLTVEIYNDSDEEYYIEGSYAQRHCTFFNKDKEPVAEIQRKIDSTTNVMLGKDVFCLSLKPGFDGAFAMGLILVLDQVYVDDDFGEHGPITMYPTNDDAKDF